MRQVVTNKTDIRIAAVLCDQDGILYEGPLADGATPAIDRDMKVRLKVGRQEYEATYMGAQSPVTTENCKIGKVTLKYVEYTVGANTYYRLPNPSDDLTTLPEGEFACIMVLVPRSTFERVGEMMIAVCDLADDTDFDGNKQHVWSKYGETNIDVSTI